MGNIIRIPSGGGMYTLVFKDGHTETIPMSKVHINMEGVDSIPQNCYPIVLSSPRYKTNHSTTSWLQTEICYGTSDDHGVICTGSRDDAGTQRHSAVRLEKGYTPICVNTMEHLQNGKLLVYSTHGYDTIGSPKYYVWAEK